MNIEYTEVTMKIVSRLDNFKNKISKDMVIGDKKIIDGIDFIKSMVISINPIIIDDSVIDEVDLRIQNEFKNGMCINKYILYGIEMSKYIVSSYVQKRPLVRIKSIK